MNNKENRPNTIRITVKDNSQIKPINHTAIRVTNKDLKENNIYQGLVKNNEDENNDTTQINNSQLTTNNDTESNEKKSHKITLKNNVKKPTIIRPLSKLEDKKKQIKLAKAQDIDSDYLESYGKDEQAKLFKAGRLFALLSVFVLCFFVFIFAVYAKIISTPPSMDPYNKKSRDYPWSIKTDSDISLRGRISSSDDFILAYTHKLYNVSVYVPSIYEEKKELLINLLHLYGGFNKDFISKTLQIGGNVSIADNVNSVLAANLRNLNSKLVALGVYKKCTFKYVNKTDIKDSEIQSMIAHAQIVEEKGSSKPRDKRVLKILDNLNNENISLENAMQKLNISLVEYKNRDIDFSKECYTPIFTYNPEVKDGDSTRIERGLDIVVNQLQREYPFNELLQPLLGFTNYGKKYIDGAVYDDKLKFIAQSGIEKYRDGILSSKKDGRVLGQADRSGNIIFNRYINHQEREDGFDIKLTIPLSLQGKIQKMLEEANEHYKAQQIVAGIMDPRTGEILALASSSSFNPNPGKRDSSITVNMRVSAAERSFEPGSTIKPLVFSYLVNKKLINYREDIDLHDGIYKLRTFTIRDSTPLKSAKPEQILIKSSNIGMTKLTKQLSGKDMQNMFKLFGVGELTGADIANEATGLLPKPSILGREVEKGAASYGYGLRMTFLQLLRSYGTFSNGGFLVTPHATKYFISPDSKIFYPTLEAPKQIISKESADYMKNLLRRVVKEGTAKRASVEGLIIGGKTGTAREKQQNGEIIYNGSFFGYASDGKNTYTIGVVAYGSQASDDYYAGQTAAPVFAKVVEILVDDGRLEKKDLK